MRSLRLGAGMRDSPIRPVYNPSLPYDRPPASAAKETGPLSRTGARNTLIVAAIARVKGAVVNIHSERTVPQPGGEAYPLPGAPSRVNGMGTGIVIDPRGYLITNHHVIDDVT